jgi:hypothetical protein
MPISPAAAPAQTHAKYERLITDAKQVPPATTIVVHPCDETSLRGAADAATARIIIPTLVGPKGENRRGRTPAQRSDARPRGQRGTRNRDLAPQQPRPSLCDPYR